MLESAQLSMILNLNQGVSEKRDRLELKLLFLIQQYINPAPEKNRCNSLEMLYELHYFFQGQQGAGLKHYWIWTNRFNFSLSHFDPTSNITKGYEIVLKHPVSTYSDV